LLSGGDVKWGRPSWWLEPWLYSSLLRIEARWIAGYAGLLLAGVGILVELVGRGARGSGPGHLRLGRRHPGLLGYAAFTLLLYYLIVARYAGSEARGVQYHLYAVPWLALAMAQGTGWLWQLGRVRRSVAGFGVPAGTGPVLVGALVAAMALQLLPRWQKVYSYRDPPLLRRAATAVAELTEPEQTILVLSDSPAVDGGVANNFQQPQLFFHAARRGRSLAKDRQTRASLEAELARGVGWLVTFDRHLSDDSGFEAGLDELYRLRLDGDGFAIYQQAPPGQATPP
ncbi:MAG: hypothetical protein MI919_23550, partial [Holophagales bacterium]|nr:hypothetical protein [Holophagales bacterium]